MNARLLVVASLARSSPLPLVVSSALAGDDSRGRKQEQAPGGELRLELRVHAQRTR